MYQFRTRFQLPILIVWLTTLFISTTAYSASITRGPYLQMGSSDGMTVRWRTDSNTNSVVRYGLSPNNLNQTAQVSGGRREHEVRITGLSPLTQYYYSVGSSSEVIAGGDASYRFMSSPSSGSSTPTRIWIIGDSGTANSNARAVYNAYLNYPGAANTNLWLMLGDNAYNSGTDSEYQDAVFDIYPELLRRTPVWSTLGNHDGYTADSASESGPYYDIFTLPRNGEVGGLASGTEAYYSFDYGDIHFICLDSYETSRSTNGAMLTWLRNDIAATNKKWIIAFWHHPPYTKGSHDSDTEGRLIDMRRNALPILEDYGVDLVFTGHSHSYERSYLIDGHYGSSGSFSSTHMVDSGNGRENQNGAYQKEDGAVNSGAVYTVAGASGKTSGGSLNHPAMYSSINQLGSVILDINGNRLDAKYLNSNGSVIDYYTLIKGPDNEPPVLLSASATEANQVMVNFSESMDQASAQNTANYSINNGINVSAASVSGSEVILTTSAMDVGTQYTLTVNNLRDEAGNFISPSSQANFSYQNIQVRSFQNGVAPTSNYSGTQDTYVASGQSGNNYGSSTDILADGSDGSNGELASLIQWDVSSIPAGSNVTEAQVVLEVFNASSGSYNLYQGGTNWNESTATWSNVDPDSNRGSQIGSMQPSSTGSYSINLNAAGIAMVQSWIDGAANQGIYVMTGGTSDGIDMRASEYSLGNIRPKLIVTYAVGSGGGNNIPPVANFSFSTNDLLANFSDQSSDSDGSLVSWQWNFGDGTGSTSRSPSHSYSSAGTYSVNLLVTDSDGATDSVSRSVTVTESNQPVVIELQQGLNSYSGAQDTYVAEGRAGSNYGNSTTLDADGDDGSRDELISLLKWDVSSIPSGVTVTDVSITLQVHNRSSGAYNFWEMEQAWSESSATWSNTQPEQNRGVFLGDFVPSSTRSYTVNLNANGVALVQSWINGSANNGITIESDGTRNGLDMRSSEYGTTSQRPKLTITYE